MTSLSRSCAVLIALAGLVACGGSQSPDANGPGGGSGAGGSGATGAGGTTGGAGGTSSGGRGGTATTLPPLPPGCSLDKPAFCETFDTPHPGGRAGEADESKISFARYSQDAFRRLRGMSFEPEITEWSNPNGPPTLCGQQFSDVLPPNDVKLCGGVLSELFYDAGGLPINSFMVRRPFDFTGRTGTVVFDVDAKRNDGWDGHGWWIEFWVTEDPAPIPYHGAPGVASHPRNGVGFQIAPVGAARDTNPQVNQLNTVSRIAITKNYLIVRDEELDPDPAIKVQDTQMNRFKVMLSKDQMEIWASDVGSQTLKKMITLTDLDLNFTIGYVHFQHVHYNASKTHNCPCDIEEIQACTCSCDGRCSKFPNSFFASSTQVYRWDNIGFDGPVYPFDRGYDVPDNNAAGVLDDDGIPKKAMQTGWNLGSTPRTVEVQNVDLTDALRATFSWSHIAPEGEVFRYRFNGKAWHEFTIPNHDEPGWVLRASTVEVPLAELVPGTNKIEIADGGNSVGNLTLAVHPSR